MCDFFGKIKVKIKFLVLVMIVEFLKYCSEYIRCLVKDVTFFFLDEKGKLEKLNYRIRRCDYA